MAKHHTLKAGYAVLFFGFYTLLVGYSLHRFYFTPTPVTADAPVSTFSEARARAHVHVLAEEIGLRSVSTPGLQRAHQYIWDFCQQLKQRAAAAGTGVLVEASFENYTGSFDFDFVGERFINTYHNISNIILHIAKSADKSSAPAVLLVAHHDSPVGSPGAGDDASNVGVMMELASNLVASEQLPASPVMFLFSGAEEPLCQSAAAFMNSSPWASRVGVFINLESIGPGGSPIVFQHAGAWTIEAYAKGAAHPRGAIAAQDIFDAGLVLGDTDYRQLSYLHRGGLPGIDIAYLLTGAAYHTDRDTLDAIRPGVLQETGDSLTGAIESLAAALAEASNSPEQLQQLLHPTDHKRMFVSIAAKVMLTYSSAAAATLHNVPLIMALTAPTALKLLIPETALPAGEGLRVMASSAGVGLVSLLSVVLVPASFGALRAWATGQAMVWFAHPWIALVTYTPVSMAVLLMPFSHMDYSQDRGKQLLPYHMLGGALLNSVVAAGLTPFGVGLAMLFALWGGFGVLAAMCMAKGMSLPALGASLLCVAWPIYSCSENALVIAIVMISRMSLTGHVFVGLGDAIVGFLIGLAATSMFGACVLPIVQALLGRASRKLAAALLLLAVIVSAAVSTGSVWPYSKDMPKRLMLGHVHCTAPVNGDVESESSSSGAPVQMHVVNSSWLLASSDSTPAGLLSAAMGFDASTAQVPTGNEFNLIYPVSKLLDMELFPAEPAVGVVDHLPQVRLVNRRSVPHYRHHLHTDSSHQGTQDGSSHGGSSSSSSSDSVGEKHEDQTGHDLDAKAVHGELTEAYLEIFTAKPCWGTLKLSGVDLVSWSITPGVWNDAASFKAGQQRGSGSALLSKQGGEGTGGDEEVVRGEGVVRSIVVKWTSEHQQGPLHWPIQVRFYPMKHHDGHQAAESSNSSSSSNGGRRSGLSIELHVGYVERTDALAEVQARMPEWSTLSFESTTYVSKWEF